MIKKLKNMTSNPFMFSFCVSLIMVSIFPFFFNGFFAVDDSLNDLAGFYTVFGKAWWNGQIPFVSNDIFLGDNSLVELDKFSLSPQTILGSIVMYKFHSVRVVGMIYAFMNIFISCISGYLIGKSFLFRKNVSLSLGFAVSICPIFLYIYCESWWNAASGHAWSFLAIATYFLLRQEVTIPAALGNFFAIFMLLLSGWPHGFVEYLVFVAVCSLCDFIYSDKLGNIVERSVPLFYAGICAVPVYSEYISLKQFIDRHSGISNSDNFLSVSFSHIIFGFSPTYYDFMHFFGGYRIILFPVCFSTILLIISVSFYKIKINRDIAAIFFVILSFFILSQTPSQLGPMRWPIRFVPFLGIMITVMAFYIAENFQKHVSLFRLKLAVGVIFVCFVVSAFKSVGSGNRFTLFAQFMTFVVSVAVVVFFCRDKQSKISIVSINFMSFYSIAIMFFILPTAANQYLSYSNLHKEIFVPSTINLTGKVLSLSRGTWERNELSELSSAQMAYFKIPAINGYAGVGNKNVDRFLPHGSSQGYFDPVPTVLALSEKTEARHCLFDMFGISTVIVDDFVYRDVKENLDKCGYIYHTESRNGRASYYSNGKKYNKALSYSSNEGVSVIAETTNGVTLNIPKNDKDTFLVLPRVWWPGYKGYGLACNVETYGYKNVLTAAKIPQGCYGKLTISYFPRTWKFSIPISVCGLFIFGGFLWLLQKKRTNRLPVV